jgi:hypothetical protein
VGQSGRRRSWRPPPNRFEKDERTLVANRGLAAVSHSVAGFHPLLGLYSLSLETFSSLLDERYRGGPTTASLGLQTSAQHPRSRRSRGAPILPDQRIGPRPGSDRDNPRGFRPPLRARHPVPAERSAALAPENPPCESADPSRSYDSPMILLPRSPAAPIVRSFWIDRR